MILPITVLFRAVISLFARLPIAKLSKRYDTKSPLLTGLFIDVSTETVSQLVKVLAELLSLPLTRLHLE